MTVALKPRWSIRAPGGAAIEAFRTSLLADDVAGAFSYTAVGASRHNAEHPRGYQMDHNRIQIGEGADDFASACAALRAWRMFPAPWTRISPPDAPLRVGEVVVMQARGMGLWWWNGAKIVYLIDERELRAPEQPEAPPMPGGEGRDPSAGATSRSPREAEPAGSETDAWVRRFGFAYGTLPAHVEQGEERFSVELHTNGSVWYDLRAFSRPHYWPVRLAAPWARRLQRRFVRDSKAAMRAALRAGSARPGPVSTARSRA